MITTKENSILTEIYIYFQDRVFVLKVRGYVEIGSSINHKIDAIPSPFLACNSLASYFVISSHSAVCKHVV